MFCEEPHNFCNVLIPLSTSETVPQNTHTSSEVTQPPQDQCFSSIYPTWYSFVYTTNGVYSFPESYNANYGS